MTREQWRFHLGIRFTCGYVNDARRILEQWIVGRRHKNLSLS
jgi:hypothetical protein